jgi:hypothetical protein
MAAHRNALARVEFACDAHATNTRVATVMFPSRNLRASSAARTSTKDTGLTYGFDRLGASGPETAVMNLFVILLFVQTNMVPI